MQLPQLYDNVPWEALAAYLANELPAEERRLVDEWLARDERHRELLLTLRRGWEANAAGRRRYDAEAALQWIKGQERVSAPVVPRFRVEAERLPRRAWLRPALRAAAVAALLVGGWWMMSRHANTTVDGGSYAGALTEYRAARGQRLTIKLPDGSSATLAPATTMRIRQGYLQGRPGEPRDIELEGEAYFEVVHNAARPFSVRTRDALVRDLGTRFVVQAYADDGKTDVVVTEGLVALGKPRSNDAASPLSSDSLLLEPGQRGRLTAEGSLEFTTAVDVEVYLGWTSGRLVFRDTPLPEALRRISRWYGVDVRLAEGVATGRTLTASFRDEPASEVTRLIAALLSLRVGRDSAGFVLRP